MPGGGYFGAFYPGQDSAEEYGSNEKTGAGISEFSSGGTDTLEASRSGTTESSFVCSGTAGSGIPKILREEDGTSKILLESGTEALLREVFTGVEGGSGRSAFLAGGEYDYEKSKAGIAQSSFSASGLSNIFERAGTATSPLSASAVRSNELRVVPTLSGGEAFRYVGNIGARSLKTAGNTISLSTMGAPVGSLVVVHIAWDNNNGSTISGPDDTQITVADAAGNTWLRVAGAQDASQANRAHVQIYASKITNEIAPSGTITATHTISSSWVAKAINAELFAIEGVAPTVAGRVHVHTRAADPAAITLSALADPSIPYLLLHGIAAEGPVDDAYTWDSDYTQFTPVGTTGGTAESNMTISGGFRVVDTTSDTVDVTSTTADRDYSQVLAALQTSAVRVGEGVAEIDSQGGASREIEIERPGTGELEFLALGKAGYSQIGTAAAALSASGERELEVDETGTAYLQAAASGVGHRLFVATGTASSDFAASASRRFIFVERGTAISPHEASSVTGKSVARAGLAKAVFTAKGQLNNRTYGAAASSFVGSGYVSERVIGRPGNAKAPLTGSGADASQRERSGPSLSIRFASGVDASVFARTGIAISGHSVLGSSFSAGTATASFVASGDAEYTVERSGTAYLDFSANGWTQPVGTAIVVFTGSGWQKDLYANDYYVNREVIDPPTGITEIDTGYRSYQLYGATANATWEDFEYGYYVDRTLWWEYTVPYVCIVAISIRPTAIVPDPLWDASPELPPENVESVLGYVSRGAPGEDYSEWPWTTQKPYGDPTVHFGQEEGRGMDADSSNEDHWGEFNTYNYYASDEVRLYIQADPRTPIGINAGKPWYWGYYGPFYYFNASYVISLERLEPPSNDNIQSAYPLDNASGTLEFDLRSATGDQRWDWDLLESVLYYPEDVRLSSDIFYRLTPTEDQWCRVRLNWIPSRDKYDMSWYNQFYVFKGIDPASWEPLPVSIIGDPDNPYVNVGPDYYYIYEYPTGYAEFFAEANETYYIAVIQVRDAGRYWDEYDQRWWLNSSSPTDRHIAYGQLEYEIIEAGLASNDDFADRLALGSGSSGSTSQADTRGSTFEVGEPSTLMYGYYQTTKTIWYEYTATASGWYVLSLDTSYWDDGYLWVFRGSSLETLELVEYEHVDTYERRLWLRGGETYAIRLVSGEGYTEDYGGFSWSFDVPTAVSNDDFANRISISAASGSDTFTNEGATNEAGEPEGHFTSEFCYPSLWWGFTPPTTGSYILRISELAGLSYYDPRLNIAVYVGSSLGNLVSISKNAWTGELGFDADAGVEYKIQVCAPLSPYTPSELGWGYSELTLEWEPFVRNTNNTLATAYDISSESFPLAWNNIGMPTEIEDGTPDLSEFIYAYYLADKKFARPMWFKFIPPHTGRYTFYFTTITKYTGFVGFYEGDSLASLRLLNGHGDGGQLYSPGYPLDVEDRFYSDTTYYILILSSDSVDEWEEARYDPSQSSQGRLAIDVEYAPINDTFNGYGDTDRSLARKRASYGNWYSITLVANAVLGSTYGATGGQVGAVSSEPSILGIESEHSVWYWYYPPVTGTYEFWIEGYGTDPVLDPRMAIYSISSSSPSTFFNNLSTIGASDDFSGDYPYLSVTLNAGTYYAIQVDSTDEGDFTILFRNLPVEAPPANDEFEDAIQLESGTLVNGTTVGARSDPYELAPESGTDAWIMGGSVWYTFTASQTQASLISFVGQTTNPARSSMTVYEETPTGLVEVVNRGDMTGGGTYNTFFGIEEGKTYYVRVMSIGAGANTGQAPFTIELLTQSETPPGNDDFGNAGTASGGTNAGSTDGSTVEPGEPDPDGGTLPSNAGTVWHKYVAPAPGFIAAYTTRDSSIPLDQWYRIGVWAGPDNSEFAALTKVTTYRDQRTQYDVMQCFYEVREGETYWIQVIRDATQAWGDYTLHIDEYLETKSWSLDDDGFTSTTNAPSISNGVMTCSGSQAISDPLNVLPQYGTVDLGADVPKWNREFRLHFEVRVIGGQVLRREMWYGGDDWSFANAASNDHVNLTCNRIGLFRLRDVDGTQILVGSLSPQKDGQNLISIQDMAGRTFESFCSLGRGGAQHDSGWTSIEVVINWENIQNYDGSGDYWGRQPHWTARIFVNGQPSTTSRTEYFPITGTNEGYSKSVRYIDLGMYRHPSMIDSHDRQYVEDPEAWTVQYRRMRATNIVPVNPYDISFAGDNGIFNFDGFSSGVIWDNQDYSEDGYWSSHYDKHYSLNAGIPYYQVTDTDVHLETLDGRTYLNSAYPTSSTAQLIYGNQSGRRRWYGFLFNYSQLPDADPDNPDESVTLAGYESESLTYYSPRLGTIFITPSGRLHIRPHNEKHFCVAALSSNTPYWIEVHVDAEVVWDVKCTLFINGASYGTFSNLFTGAEVASDYSTWNSNNIYSPTPTAEFPNVPDTPYLRFGPRNEYDQGSYLGTAFQHDLLFTYLVTGRGLPDDMVGPLKTTTVNAIEETAGHWLPEEPEDYLEIEASSGVWINQPDTRLYGWMYEDTDAGPILYEDPGGAGISAPLPVISPRYWEPYFRLRATTPLLVSGAGPYQYTMVGQSVPVTATVAGIAIHAPAGTAQLLKNGSPVGDPIVSGTGYYGDPEEMWGTTWTPQEINDLQFGVQLSVAAAALEDVRIEVYFADYGSPDGIGRGAFLDAAGLYNLYGDTVVCEYTATGSGGNVGFEWPTGGWEPSFIGGGSAGTLSGTPVHRWGALRPLWLWQARGDKVPYVTLSAGTPNATVTDVRIVRNPLAYPRYAWSDDNGATWTWIHLGEAASVDHIGTDVGSSSAGKAIFLDTAGTLDVYMHQNGGWSAGLTEDRPSSSYAYRHMWYYLGFTGGATSETEILSVNLWTRSRPYDALPSASNASESRYRAAISDGVGGVRRMRTFRGFSGTESSPNLLRATQNRAADGAAWTPGKFNALTLRIGMHTELTGGTGFVINAKTKGAALYAATWELLVPDLPGTAPSPCVGPKYVAKIHKKQ